MTRGALLAGLLAIAAMTFGSVAGGQAPLPAAGVHGEVSGGGTIGDVPTGAGVLRGQLVRRSGDASLASVELTLFALGAGGKPGIRKGTTEADGRFEFTGLSTDPTTMYLVGARYDDVPFGARVRFEPDTTELFASIEVNAHSPDGSPLQPGAARIRVERGCSGVRVTESHALHNPTDQVLLVPTDRQDAHPPIFQIPLPDGATFFDSGGSTLDGGAVLRGQDVVFNGPVYPGDSEVEFAYSLASDESSLQLTRRFPRGAEKAVVMVSGDDGPQGAGLGPVVAVMEDGAAYRSAESGTLAPGAAITFEIPRAPRSEEHERLTVRELKTWLELDDAALDVREQYELMVDGDTPLRSDTGAPLLCVALPTGAEDIRFSQDAFAMGIEPDANGSLSLRGPLPAGPSFFGLAYRLRTNDGGSAFTRGFDFPLTLLSMYIADTGVITSTGRLHRRRPVQTTDRVYIHLEGFEIEAGETVAVGLASLPAPRPLPRIAGVAFVATAAILVVAVLSAPLRRAAAGGTVVGDASVIDAERNAVYEAIRDLEDDFETGKISPDDHASMLRELRGRAGALLARERSAAPSEGTEASASEIHPTCAGCGAALAAGSRFCSQCGDPVAAAPDARTPAA